MGEFVFARAGKALSVLKEAAGVCGVQLTEAPVAW